MTRLGALALAACCAACVRGVPRGRAGDAGHAGPADGAPDADADLTDARDAAADGDTPPDIKPDLPIDPTDAPGPIDLAEAASEGPRACTTSMECSSTERCAAGRCVFGARFGGDTCTSSSECLSAVCVGGVCCDLGCKGPCQSCSLPGKVGVCSPAPKGTPDPRCAPFVCGGDPSCPVACKADADCIPGTPCTTGVCGHPDGAPCSAFPTTICRSGFCREGLCCDTSCSGACSSCSLPGSPGTCGALPVGTPRYACGLYLCGGALSCPVACLGDADCKPGLVCSPDGRCGRVQGLFCTGSAECLSGFCIGEICCDKPCGDLCTSCLQPGKLGTCSPVPAGSLAAGCHPYRCSGAGACLTTCSLDTDCSPGSGCKGGKCRRPLGAYCGLADDCLSGICADSVCCDSLCDGPCRRCSLFGMTGICSKITSGSDYPSCTGGYFCDIDGNCTKP